MGLSCLNIKRACIRIFPLIFPWWLDCQRFITASLLMFSRNIFSLCGGIM
ncbi:peptidyl-dipeptidase dcp [Salmonella enterica subsp. enterica serovar Eingedi]|nr:peptidyl-dipeptidase dcp [Salmonella enterica subsp. enterica serovar Eingedi]